MGVGVGAGVVLVGMHVRHGDLALKQNSWDSGRAYGSKPLLPFHRYFRTLRSLVGVDSSSDDSGSNDSSSHDSGSNDNGGDDSGSSRSHASSGKKKKKKKKKKKIKKKKMRKARVGNTHSRGQWVDALAGTVPGGNICSVALAVSKF
jgi:hypothetical protein